LVYLMTLLSLCPLCCWPIPASTRWAVEQVVGNNFSWQASCLQVDADLSQH
jgi:hypothetical protein